MLWLKKIIPVNGKNEFENYLQLLAAAKEDYGDQPLLLFHSGHARELEEYEILSRSEAYIPEKDGQRQNESRYTIVPVSTLLQRVGKNTRLISRLVHWTEQELRQPQIKAQRSFLDQREKRIRSEGSEEELKRFIEEKNALESALREYVDRQISSAQLLGERLNHPMLLGHVQAARTLVTKHFPQGN